MYGLGRVALLFGLLLHLVSAVAGAAMHTAEWNIAPAGAAAVGADDDNSVPRPNLPPHDERTCVFCHAVNTAADTPEQQSRLLAPLGAPADLPATWADVVQLLRTSSVRARAPPR